MIKFDFKFENKNGLHARPAGELVQEVKKLSSEVFIEVPGASPELTKLAKADGLFALMGLGIKEGTSVVVLVDGKDKDVEASDAEVIKKFMEIKFSGLSDSE